MSVQSTETSYCPPGSITTLLSLNDDVVTIILSFIEPHEAFQLAKSSRYAYAIAMPRVLSEVRVSWYRWQNEYNAFQGCSEYVLSFCSFMLADVEHRIPCLKKLYISGMTFMQQQFDNTPLLAMAELLRRATWLREIELENVDNLLDSEPHFAAALAALPCLDIVSLRGVQHYDSFRMLSRMVSSPRKLELQCSSSMQGEETTFREFMQSPRLIPSLKDLRLRWCAHLIDKLNIHNVLPSVRSLELDGSMCSLSMAAHTFPNLRSIHLGFEFEAASCLASWPNLDHIVIQEPSPYYRPLACPVRWLEIGFSVTQTVFPSILSLVERTSPVVLCLRKVVPREIDMGRLANVVPSLRYLELQMDQLKDSWIVDKAAAFRSAPLLGISISAKATVYNHVAKPALSRLAQQVAACIPTLQFVEVGHRTGSRSRSGAAPQWYRVVSRGGENDAQVEMLLEWEADTIRRRLLDTPRS
ncbi:hypothetical protein AcW1_007656 [Taiwanofungus camphoratus]|nr:hypothetical protein AcW2_007284 [Antrodia cinnamomea]KAI0926971.1 hypothetical protein AcV5_007624 [Antrodia cinnamomea]KAI0947423.1 hypothetical protein AcV7_009859 [Antrodia cinnamomea]KAI0953433.1 hypothetical protein AcW1_007656 [Antrodia cinnamomea]